MLFVPLKAKHWTQRICWTHFLIASFPPFSFLFASGNMIQCFSLSLTQSLKKKKPNNYFLCSLRNKLEHDFYVCALLSSQPLWQKIIFICFSPSVFSLPARVSFTLKVFLHFWYKNGITQNFSEVWNVGKIPQNLLYMFFKCWLPDLFVKD